MRGIKWSLFVMIITLAAGVKCELNLLLYKSSAKLVRVSCYDTDTSSYLTLFKYRDRYTEVLDKGRVIDIAYIYKEEEIVKCASNKSNLTTTEIQAKSSLNCTRGYFGKDCNIKCEDVLGEDYKHCQKHLICSNEYNNRECFCAPGYWGGYCANVCKETKDIRKKNYCNNGCGHCDYTKEGQHCDLDTKQCYSTCEKGYMGPSCTQRTVDLFEKVTTKDIDYNSANIHIDFIKPKKINNNDISLNIGVKGLGDTNVRPTTVKLNENDYIEQEINDLKPGMNYSLDITFDGVPVVQEPVFNFITKCDDLGKDNTNIGINENSSTIEIKITPTGDEKKTCNIRLYKVKVNEIEVDEKKYEIKDDGELIIQNFHFCNKSTITLYNPESNKQINSIEYTPTSEPAPGIVKTVQNRSSTTDDSIHIEWSPPDNGCNIVIYEVSYKFFIYTGCYYWHRYVSENESQQIDNTTSTSYDITGLKPYNRYVVTVTAYNTKRGKGTFNIFETKEKDIPTEIITDLKIINLDHTKVILQWSKPECTSITGSLQYKVTVLRTSISMETTKTTVTLPPLEGYTKYIVEVAVMRPSTGKLSDVKSITFTTDPTAPPAVRELQVYSHTDTSIGLRWKHPKPANGQLEHYSVDCPCLDKYEYIKNIDTSCDLWKEYFCYELNYLTSNKECTVRVHAYNKNVLKPSKESSVEVKTKFTGPGQPPDLSTEFLNNTELLVKWGHPIEHGPVYNFYVGARVVDSNVGALTTSETIQVVKPKEEYTHQFSLSQSTTYDVCVRGTNKLEGLSNCTTVITEPEAIEFELNTANVKEAILVFIKTKDRTCRNCTTIIFAENEKITVNESLKNAPQDVIDVYPNYKEWANITKNEQYYISRTDIDHDLHITVILFNCYKHKCKRQDKHVLIESESFPLGYIFLLFLLIIPAAVIIFVYLKIKSKTNIPKNSLEMSSSNARQTANKDLIATRKLSHFKADDVEPPNYDEANLKINKSDEQTSNLNLKTRLNEEIKETKANLKNKYILKKSEMNMKITERKRDSGTEVDDQSDYDKPDCSIKYVNVGVNVDSRGQPIYDEFEPVLEQHEDPQNYDEKNLKTFESVEQSNNLSPETRLYEEIKEFKTKSNLENKYNLKKSVMNMKTTESKRDSDKEVDDHSDYVKPDCPIGYVNVADNNVNSKGQPIDDEIKPAVLVYDVPYGHIRSKRYAL